MERDVEPARQGDVAEAARGLASLHARVQKLPARDRPALATLCPLRGTVGHAVPELCEPGVTRWRVFLPELWMENALVGA